MLSLAVYGMFLNKDGSKVNIYYRMRTIFFGDTGKETAVVSSLVIGMSLYSNIFSGYSLAGVSNEATWGGFYAVRWLAFSACANQVANLALPRIRAAFQHRNYVCFTDIAADRFNSSMVRVVCSIAGLMNSVAYTTAQFVALGETIDTVTHQKVDSTTSMWLLMAFMFICEASGSMSSVMLTDAVQSTVMIFGVMAFSLTLLRIYGPVGDFAPWDCKRGDCIADKVYGILYNNPGNGEARFDEQMDKTGDDKLNGWYSSENMYWNYVGFDMFSFSSLALGFLTSPHVQIRNMTTRNDTNIKRGNGILQALAMITQLPIMYVTLKLFFPIFLLLRLTLMQCRALY